MKIFFPVAFFVCCTALTLVAGQIGWDNWRVWVIGGIAGLINVLGYIEGRMQE